ncbi:MAG: aminotransferase class III-fold pyridoxal phosphate-dependent enzyme [Chlorobium sp.]
MSNTVHDSKQQDFTEWHGHLVALCCSEESELPVLAKFHNGLHACPEGCCRIVETESGRPYLICITGHGMVAAAASAAHLFDAHKVGLLVALGFMGRICASISREDVILVSKTANYASISAIIRPKEIDADHVRSWTPLEEIKQLAYSSAQDCQFVLKEGTVISAEGPLHDGDVSRQLSRQFSAVGVDMETAAIAQVAELRNRAWLSFRMTSDDADQQAAKDYKAACEHGVSPALGKVVETLVDRLAAHRVGPASIFRVDASINGDTEKNILSADQATVFHPFSGPNHDDSCLPRVVSRAFGVRMWDERGRCYFDGIAGTKNVCLGHGHPAVFPFLIEQNSRLAHWPADGFTNEVLVSFSEKLARLFPGTLGHVFANSSGSEAVETALRLSREYHRCRGEGHRYRVLALTGGYHGATAGALSITGHAASRYGAGPLMEGVIFIDPPVNGEPSAVEEALVRLENALELSDPESFASIIFEPTQGLGGVRPLPTCFLQGLLQTASDIGALAIADEVASGLGRTGLWFDFLRVQREPDIVVCGKALTNGTIPLSATVASDRIFDVITARFSSLRHGHTFSGHPLAAAAACRVLDTLSDIDVLSRVNARVTEFQSHNANELRQLPHVADVRNAGLWIGIELRSLGYGEPPPVRRFSRALTQNGVIHEVLGATIALSPSLTICQEDWEEIGAILVRTFQEES